MSSEEIISLVDVHENTTENISIQQTMDTAVITLTRRDGSEVQASLDTRVVLENFSVKNFGAVGDGVTDDTDAVQQTIDSRKLVYIPTGIYLIRSELHMREGSLLFGDGHDKSVLLKGIHSSHYDPWFMLNARGADDVLVRDLGMNGNRLDINKGGLLAVNREINGDVASSSNFLVENCRFYKWNPTITPQAALFLNVNALTIERCVFVPANENVQLGTDSYISITSDGCSKVSVRNNRMEASFTDPISVFIELYRCSKTVVDGNTFRGARFLRADEGNLDELTVSRNVCIVTDSAIDVSGSCGDLSVTGNSFRTITDNDDTSELVRVNGTCTNALLNANNFARSTPSRSNYSLLYFGPYTESLSLVGNTFRMAAINDGIEIVSPFEVAFVRINDLCQQFVVANNVFRGSTGVSIFGKYIGVSFGGSANTRTLAFMNSGTGTEGYTSYTSVGDTLSITN
jgi:hypothetical protein